MATLTTLVSFSSTDGHEPTTGLVADAAGDLFGTTTYGGANNYGTVFEIAKTATGYASTPTTLVSFNVTNGQYPYAGLIADAAGNLFGTTSGGGANGGGTVFEIAKAATGYASTPTALVSFDRVDGNAPYAGLIADTAGNLFGTTYLSGAYNYGTVFEIAKTATGYASTPTTLVSFNSTDGANPYAGLIADGAGDLFGTTSSGGANGDGTVLEIVKTATGYASTPTTLVSFNSTDGADPFTGDLIADAAGDLFGTTLSGGANGDGTVFEIAKTATGYASTPTTLVTFNGTDGANPYAGLIADGAGDLFGTTRSGGVNEDGTVFEIAKTATGYASTPTTLVSFNSTDGANPDATLIADGAGNLFGTTAFGGANNLGTAFELSGIGSTPTPTPTPSPPWLPTLGPPNNFAVSDQSTTGPYAAGSWQSAGIPYSGPVAGLISEFIAVTPDNINVTATTPNTFISLDGGSGEDAIAVNQVNGNNVLNGSTGSSFLYGGTGNDTFFVDDRNPPAGSSIWSTVVGFHSGDAATIWGVTPSDFTLSWVDGQGAAGYTGLTLHATAPGEPTASLTLAGFTSADLTNGTLTVTYGTTAASGGVPGSNYMYVHAT